MSKKQVQDSSNPFLNIDKTRFAKNSGERDQRGQTYIRNKSLNKLAKKAQAEASSGADEKAGDYFTSLMSMGGVTKMKNSPKVNKNASANPNANSDSLWESKKDPGNGIFAEWARNLDADPTPAPGTDLGTDLNTLPHEDLNALSDVSMAEIFAEPQTNLPPKEAFNHEQRQTPSRGRQKGQQPTFVADGEFEKNRQAQANRPASAGTMSAMLSGVKVKEEPKLEKEDIGTDKTQEEKLLSDYLACSHKKTSTQVASAGQSSSSQNSFGSQKTPSAFNALAEFDPDSEEHVFSQAMQQVAPLAGKGRAVVPEPERPASQIFPDNPLQDFLDGKVEFSLEFTDEYLEGHVLGLDPAVIGKMRAGSFSYEAHLDLHGLNAPQAFDALVTFIRASYQRGRRSVLLIPGRGKNSPDGTGILRDKMQEWLTQDPLKRVVLAFCTALPKDGGPGALYVLLRKLKKSRGKIMWDRRPSDPDLFV